MQEGFRVWGLCRRSDISYYSNVVASSYSHVWWTIDDWTEFLDWAALSGVNLALAYTGQEEIFRKTFSEFGISDEVFGNWSNGAAWLAWSRGQSMHGVGTSDSEGNPPLSKKWMLDQWVLQRQILAHMRSLGMVSVLPAFQGNVPPLLASLFPTANISLQGSGRHYAAWLDALDPLFAKIGDRYMQHLIADFGTDHWYEADGYFSAGSPPWLSERTGVHVRMREDDPDPRLVQQAREHGEAAYQAMNRTDPLAIW